MQISQQEVGSVLNIIVFDTLCLIKGQFYANACPYCLLNLLVIIALSQVSNNFILLANAKIIAGKLIAQQWQNITFTFDPSGLPGSFYASKFSLLLFLLVVKTKAILTLVMNVSIVWVVCLGGFHLQTVLRKLWRITSRCYS